MTIEAKIDRTNELLAALLAALSGEQKTVAKEADAAAVSPAPKPAVKPVAKPAVKPVAKPAAKPVAKPAEAESVKEMFTLEDAKRVFVELMKAKGKEAGVAVLAALGANKLPDLDPSQYGELVQMCNAEMG